jgi:MoxR-like ATPase
MPAPTSSQLELSSIRAAISRVFIGHPDVVDRLLTCLLARGHILIEDVPGVGKTLLATSLARVLDCTFSRVQLTPDLLPTDILGTSIYQRDSGTFQFNPGPIFANIVLADEINRTSPRTQAALLEAMSDAAVSIDGATRKLDAPFMLIATDNPFEFEGTFPLPENQLDRFLMRISVGYPSPEDEARVLELRPSQNGFRDLQPILKREQIIALQNATDQIRVDRSITNYIIAFANATRSSKELALGLSPRGSLALAQASRAAALLAGRDHVTPEDVISNIIPVCAHRVFAHAQEQTDRNATTRVLTTILSTIPAPL